MKLTRILTAALGLSVLAACSDTNAPDEPFDPVTSSQDVKSVEDAFNSDVYNSLDALGGAFMIPGASLSMGAVGIVEEAASEKTGYSRIVQLTEQIVANFAGPNVVLIPDQYRGLTLVFDPATADYVVDTTRTDGPANGIRFILYAVNPVTHDIAEPLNEIGFADLLDESTDTAGVIRIVVASGGVEFLNYTTSLTGTLLTPTININGFVQDGTTRVDIDLTNSAAVNVGGITVTLDYDLSVPASDFSVTANLVITATDQSESVALDAQFTQGPHTIRIAGEIVNGAGTLTVTVDGDAFAVVALEGDAVSVTGPDGQPLTDEQARALEDIVKGFEEVFDSFDTFFEPVSWLFGGPAGL